MGEAKGKESYKELKKFLKKEYSEQIVYPPKEDIWTAFKWTSYEDVKVVILGQDPYHGEGQAHGLSFSVKKDKKIPPSLRNIFKELADDLNVTPASHGYLKKWAEQGVFLLNTVLTVRAGEAGSHRGKGWEELTDSVIRSLNRKENSIIFILWGAEAKKKRKLINEEKHFIVESVHPSPLSAYRGFFKSKPFSKTNKLLIQSGQKEIHWQLDDQDSSD
ncbi:MAG: uracil-DNA glycosylase [Atopostipes suicloacalis]|nr:uracil-DNA glycosylase [Atopostipes suicloacalis]